MSAFAKTVLAALAAALVLAPAARAGTYDVQACNTPAGKFTNHSWTITVAGQQFISIDCAASDARPAMALQTDGPQVYDPGRKATLTFTAPAGSTIADFRLVQQMYQRDPRSQPPLGELLYTLLELGDRPLEGSGTYQSDVMTRLGGHGAWHPNPYQPGPSTTDLAGYAENAGYKGDATTLRYTIGCYTSGCELARDGQPSFAFIEVQSATVTINDPTPPALTAISPTGLAAPGAVGGDEPLLFDASDSSGIKRAELLDLTDPGEPKSAGAIDYPCDYSYATPCPQLTNARVAVTPLAPGLRTLKLRLTDAAGNVTDSAPLSVTVGGALNGTGATPLARLTASFAGNRAHRDVGFGGSARIGGRLTDATGAPITGATIQVLDRELRTGTRYAQRLELTTDAEGRFSVRPGRGAARAIRFEYRSRRQLATASAAAAVELRVAAGAALRVSPRRVRPRGTITISGRLRGLPLPRSGKVVDLQAFERGKWRTFDTARARGRTGRFSSRYRFLRAGSGASFLIRARVRRDDSYPYYLGYSPRVRVRIR